MLGCTWRDSSPSAKGLLEHLERHFRTWHKVSDYADRLGYPTRTLNRLSRQHSGLTAKELIDERIVLKAKPDRRGSRLRRSLERLRVQT
jgi:AraC-like DNA-binding protein